MPSLTMRGRYLMREYWADSDLFLKLDAETREFYIGLWMLADDDGWLPRDVPGIGAAVYQYMDRTPRERLVTEKLLRLQRMGKVRSLRCCIQLPSVTRYPRAGKKSTAHHLDHRTHSKGFDSRSGRSSNGFEGIQTDLKPSPVPSSSLPDVARAPAQEGGAALSEFRARVPRPGQKAAS